MKYAWDIQLCAWFSAALMECESHARCVRVDRSEPSD